MEQSSAIWMLIGLSLIVANLPFLLQRPLLALPWAQKGEPQRPMLLRWLESLVFFALLYGVCWLAYDVIGGALVMSTNVASVLSFYGKIAAYIVGLGVLMFYPGWRLRRQSYEKSFLARLIELFVLFLTVGVLAFAIETNLGNRFPQTWQFYAINASLFVVLGYPGFVLRYLLKRSRRPRRQRQPSGSGETSSAHHPAQ